MFMTATTVLPALAALFLPSLVQASVTPFRVQDDITVYGSKVPVVLGVRSRDKDALLCQSVFDQVLKRVPDKVDLSFAYVANIDASDKDFGVSCENGYYECAGNVQQLCVHNYVDSNRWWQFVMCQNYHGYNEIGSLGLAHKCARSAGIDLASGVGNCIGSNGKGVEGVRLLQQNVETTQEAEIDTSCTVVINKTPVCVHDGAWKECEDGHTANDFVRQINAEWSRINNFMDEPFLDKDV